MDQHRAVTLDRQVLRTTSTRMMAGYLKPVTFGLIVIFILYAIGERFLTGGPAGNLASWVLLLSCPAVYLVGVVLVARLKLERHAHEVAAVLAAIAWINCTVTLAVIREPIQSTNYLILVLGAGSLLFSGPLLVGLLVATWASWGWLVAGVPPWNLWLQYGITLGVATILSGIIFLSRWHALTRAIQSEERYRRLAEASSEGIALLDSAKILDANPAFLSMFGCGLLEVLGRDVRGHLILASGMDEWSKSGQEGVGVRKDGRTFPIEVRTGWLRSHGRELRILMVTDLTERKSAGQLIAEQQRMLFQADKLSALGEMAAGIAHEIRNPLTSILLQAEFLRKREEAIRDPEFVARAVGRIADDATRINRIIHGIRVISRQGGEDALAEECSLKSLIQDSIELCRERFTRHGIRVQVDPIPEECVLRGNPTQILQVLINLISNAQDAVEDARERWVRISTKASGNASEIWVSDSGPGVPHEVREKIMQPFFTTKGTGKGTGLGLSISKKIIEAHGGTLRLDEAGPNTCFVVRLPVTEPVQEARLR